MLVDTILERSDDLWLRAPRQYQLRTLDRVRQDRAHSGRIEAQWPAHAGIPETWKVVLRHPRPHDRADESVAALDRGLIAVTREYQHSRLVCDGRLRAALCERVLGSTIHQVLIQRSHCWVICRVRDRCAEQCRA